MNMEGNMKKVSSTIIIISLFAIIAAHSTKIMQDEKIIQHMAIII